MLSPIELLPGDTRAGALITCRVIKDTHQVHDGPVPVQAGEELAELGGALTHHQYLGMIQDSLGIVTHEGCDMGDGLLDVAAVGAHHPA